MLLWKFSHVPTEFDENLPIISRSEKDTTKQSSTTNKLSFRNSIGITCEHLVYGYVSDKILEIPIEIQKICFNFFIGDFPSSIYDDTLCNFNEKAKIEFIQSSFHLLCPGTIKQSGSKLLLVHFIRLAQNCMIDDESYAYDESADRMFLINSAEDLQNIPSDRSRNIHYSKITNKAYYRRVYLSYLSSLTEVTNFFDILNTTVLSEVQSGSVVQQTNFPNDENTIYIYSTNSFKQFTVHPFIQKFENYGVIEKLDVIDLAEIDKELFSVRFNIVVRQDRFFDLFIFDSCINVVKKEATDYKELIIDIACKISNDFSIELIYRLIAQNNEFYELYKGVAGNIDSNRLLIPSTIRFVAKNQLEMNSLRKLFIPLVYVFEKKPQTDIVDDPSHYISLLMFDPMFNEIREKNQKIALLWLQKEVEYGLLNAYSNICLHKTFLQSIMRYVLSKLQKKEDLPTTIISIGFEILHLLVESSKLDIVYKITNFKLFSQIIVTELLWSDKHAIIGWKILNIEIEKMIKHGNVNQEQYEYFDEWISYIESKTGVFQTSVVSSINILKKKQNESMKDARIQLELATAVCFKINQLQCDKFKFNKFYHRLEKTQLIKPILRGLVHNNI